MQTMALVIMLDFKALSLICLQKLIVTGGDSTDMPIPFNVTDDLSFDTILNDSLTCFKLDLSQPELQQPVLIDKTGILVISKLVTLKADIKNI